MPLRASKSPHNRRSKQLPAGDLYLSIRARSGIFYPGDRQISIGGFCDIQNSLHGFFCQLA
jgi:hypothetical protein